MTHELPLEEGHVEAGGVVVDELEQKHLHGQPVLVLQVGLWDFCGKNQVCTVNTRRSSKSVPMCFLWVGGRRTEPPHPCQ